MRALGPVETPLQVLLQFLSLELLQALVDATNSKAARSPPGDEYARGWKPVTIEELLLWLGLLFSMGMHIEKSRPDHWAGSGARFAGRMGRIRWEQIHRFLSPSTPDSRPPDGP